MFAVFASATLALGDPGQVESKALAKAASSPSPYLIVSHIDEADQQISLKDGKLLTHRRATDPFGLAIGGKFKGLPPVAEHPTANPAKTNEPVQLPVNVDEPTLEKAVQQLPIGGVDIARSRSVNRVPIRCMKAICWFWNWEAANSRFGFRASTSAACSSAISTCNSTP